MATTKILLSLLILFSLVLRAWSCRNLACYLKEGRTLTSGTLLNWKFRTCGSIGGISCSRANDRVPSRCDRDLNDASLQLQIFNKKPSSIPQWPGKLTIKVTKMGKLIVNPTMTTSYGWIRTVMVLLGNTVFFASNSASISMGISMGTIGIAVPFLSKNWKICKII